MEKEKIRNKYQELLHENEILLLKLKRRLFILSMLRLVIFLAGAAAVVLAFGNSVISGIIVIIFFTASFILLVIYYTRLSENIEFTQNLVSINLSELKAFKGDYSAFNGGNEWKDQDHDFSNDTDLFGDDSLFRYLNRTVTGYGREILAGWLSDPYKYRDSIKERQEAIIELAGKYPMASGIYGLWIG